MGIIVTKATAEPVSAFQSAAELCIAPPLHNKRVARCIHPRAHLRMVSTSVGCLRQGIGVVGTRYDRMSLHVEWTRQEARASPLASFCSGCGFSQRQHQRVYVTAGRPWGHTL